MRFFSNHTDFGKKLKALRTAYNLKSDDLARYCTIVNESRISKGSISFWENGKNSPSIDSAYLIANIFGVSLNWLISDYDYPEKPVYDELRLEYLEYKIIERSQNYIIRGEEYTFPYFETLSSHKEYIELEKRKLYYSHEARANIIFLMYVIDFEWQRYVKANITEFKSLNELTLKDLAMRVWDLFMTVPGDAAVIRKSVKDLQTIMETKKPLYKVRW